MAAGLTNRRAYISITMQETWAVMQRLADIKGLDNSEITKIMKCISIRRTELFC